jgi:hypothetical protein
MKSMTLVIRVKGKALMDTGTKNPAACRRRGFGKQGSQQRRSDDGLGLAQAHDTVALFPLPTFAEQIDALKTLQNITFLLPGCGAYLKAIVL